MTKIRRFGLLVATIVLPFGVVRRVAGDTPTPCTSTPRNHVIEITATHNSCKHANVSMNTDNKIDWYSADGTTLTIAFTGANPYKIFGCGVAVHLPNNKCMARNLGNVKVGGEYEYTPSIDGKPTKDPNIIINP